MANIFISYSRKDKEFVDRLIGQLEEAGYPVWVDREGIRGGDLWAEKIVQALEISPAFILVLSPNSAQSDNVRRELDLAQENKVPIFPIMIAPTEPSDAMKYQLAGLQYIDLYSDYQAGLENLKRGLAEKEGTPPPPTSPLHPPSPPPSFLQRNKYWLFGVLAGVILIFIVLRALIVPPATPPGNPSATQTISGVASPDTVAAKQTQSAGTAIAFANMATEAARQTAAATPTEVASQAAVPTVNTPSPTPTAQATWQPCPSTYPSQLHVGMRTSVSFNPRIPNNVRSQPNVTATIIGKVDPGEQMDILAGPTCQNGWVWWEIRSLTTGLTGWTAEGDGQNYWLLPVSTSTPSVSNHPHLAFASDRDGSMHIYLMDTNNPGNYIPLPIPPGYNWSWWPSFCGDRIATEVQDTSPTKKPQWVYLLDPVNGTSERLNISEDADMLGVPRCSPDGKYIAYSIHQNNVWGMSIAELSGSQAIAIASLDALGYTSWPKTNYDFFFMDKSKNFSIKKVANFPASGVTETQEILSNAKYPAISPDGNSLAYACESVTKLCVRNLRTNQTTPLAPLNYTKVGDRQMPATAMWSSDGRWIYYSSADSGKWDILRIHPDGSGLENITSSWSSNELAPALQW